MSDDPRLLLWSVRDWATALTKAEIERDRAAKEARAGARLVVEANVRIDAARAELAQAKADLDSVRQLAADYNEEIVAAHAELAQYKAAANQILAWCDAAEHPEWDVGADLPSVQTAILRTCLASALSGEDQS